jgi:hypothetical protein
MMFVSNAEIEIIKSAAGWYDFNWYDQDTDGLVYYLYQWRYNKRSVYYTTKVVKYLRLVKEYLPTVNDNYDFAYQTLRKAEYMFLEHLEYIA